MSWEVLTGDCLQVMPTLEPNSVDSIVTDPPYGLSQGPAGYLGEKKGRGFMGKEWDHGVPGPQFWREALRVAKPGSYLLAFGGTRTFHRLAVAIEDAGWEIRDTVMWVYAQGYPKSHDISKAIDREAGAEREKVRVKPRPETSGTMISGSDTRPWIEKSREVGYHEVAGPEPATPAAAQWAGWGTHLKPAWEPVIVARKPLDGTVAQNVLTWGTGGINVDGCRVGTFEKIPAHHGTNGAAGRTMGNRRDYVPGSAGTVFNTSGRWPANLVHDGSDEVVGLFPMTAGKGHTPRKRGSGGISTSGHEGQDQVVERWHDAGSAARFFYCAKASKADRDEGLSDWPLVPAGGMEGRNDGSMGSITLSRNHHPTVKPTAFLRYLCRLVTPPGGIVLDPFAGSGSTGKAAMLEGFGFIGIEKEEEYAEIARARIAHAAGQNRQLEML